MRRILAIVGVSLAGLLALIAILFTLGFVGGGIGPAELPLDRRPLTPQTTRLDGFPAHCAQPGYCQPGVDSWCTIIYVAYDIGTDPADIAAIVRDGQVTKAQLNLCPQYRSLLPADPADP